MQSLPPGGNAVNNAAQFNTTHWSVVLLAGQLHSSAGTAALENLCRCYWPPIYYFARRKGYSDADAKDFTQQFFSRLLARNDFAGLDARKGKFRTFLLAAFTHFLANEHDRATALKRGGGEVILPLDELSDEQLGQFEAAGDFPPAKSFDKNWALVILTRTLARLKAEMREASKERQFELLKIFLTVDGQAGVYEGVAQKLGVAPGSVPVAVHRLRQRYRELARAAVAETVSSPTDLDEEMRHLFAVLNQ